MLRPHPSHHGFANSRLTPGLYSAGDIARLLAGEHASHLCHQTNCINPAHIVVEPKARNEARKACRALGPIIRTQIGGEWFVLDRPGGCECPGEKCIAMVEVREARRAEEGEL
jgi:hypothetical protein